MKCTGCGANIVTRDGETRARCDYCGVVLKVPKDKGDALAIIVRMLQDEERDHQLARAKKEVLAGRHSDANAVLNDIIKKDPKNARAYFYKSLLDVYPYRAQLGHIDRAIELATPDMKKIYTRERKVLVKNHRRDRRKSWALNLAVVLGLIFLIGGGVFLTLYYLF